PGAAPFANRLGGYTRAFRRFVGSAQTINEVADRYCHDFMILDKKSVINLFVAGPEIISA
ncbi:MAG TPA: hypothetical protein PLI12_09220, partial [Acetobacteraceae bacterium]|nr:hypothetical protein [Acetobacteraceae bacterium]